MPWELPLPAQTVAQRLALDVRHREPELAGGLARVEDGEDVGVLEPGGEPDLPLEALRAERGRQLGMEQLERHRAIVLQVLRQEHGGHPAPAQLALEHVAARQPVLEACAEVGHGVSSAGGWRRMSDP